MTRAVNGARVKSHALYLPYREETLDNGLRVLVIPRPEVHRAVITMLFRVGSRFESAGDNGISHFLEHMLYRGSPSLKTAHDQALAFEGLGASLYAATQADYGTMNLTLPPESLAAAVPLFAEVVKSPRFSSIETERGIVREEILEDLDDDGRQIDADNLVRELIYDEHPLGFSITGPIEHLDQFDKAKLRRHHARHYTASNAVLCFAGAVSTASCLRMARKHFSDLKPGRRVAGEEPRFAQKKPRVSHVANASSQTTLRVAFRALSDRDPREPALEMLLRVLDDGMSTRLYERICDDKGLCYDVGALYESYEDDGVFDIAAEAQHARIADVVREILGILRDLAERGPSTEELDRAKARNGWQMRAMLDDAEGLAGYFALSALAGLVPTPAERHEQLVAVAPKDVREVADLVFRSERMSVVTVGSLGDAKRETLARALETFRSSTANG
ncbi:MAG TPA: pitrilysin family protein [Polyangiaceae bacterium]